MYLFDLYTNRDATKFGLTLSSQSQVLKPLQLYGPWMNDERLKNKGAQKIFFKAIMVRFMSLLGLLSPIALSGPKKTFAPTFCPIGSSAGGV